MSKYEKLVRDRIPEIIVGNGETPIVRILDNKEFEQELIKKLFEECTEVQEASGNERLEELADVLEVIRALASLEDKRVEDILQIADKKTEKRGAFAKRLYLEGVEEA